MFIVCLATFPAMIFSFIVAINERNITLKRIKKSAIHLARLTSREHAHQIQGPQKLLLWLGKRLSKNLHQLSLIKDKSFFKGILAGHTQLVNIGILSPNNAMRSDSVVSGTYVISPVF